MRFLAALARASRGECKEFGIHDDGKSVFCQQQIHDGRCCSHGLSARVRNAAQLRRIALTFHAECDSKGGRRPPLISIRTKENRRVAAAVFLSAEGSSTNETAAVAGGCSLRFRESHIDHRVEEISVLSRPGSDLLFQALRLSTIGAGEFNGRVRDGIGFRLPANTTRSAKNGYEASIVFHVRSLARSASDECALKIRAIKPIELLGPVSSTHCCAYTPGLSTWWSTTALFREISFRGGFLA